MANTVLLKTLVESEVRKSLTQRFGVSFSSRVLKLTTGGTHEFDAVSDDGQVVAGIKSNSGLTSGGLRPSAKIKDAIAEIYFLSLVSAPRGCWC